MVTQRPSRLRHCIITSIWYFEVHQWPPLMGRKELKSHVGAFYRITSDYKQHDISMIRNCGSTLLNHRIMICLSFCVPKKGRQDMDSIGNLYYISFNIIWFFPTWMCYFDENNKIYSNRNKFMDDRSVIDYDRKLRHCSKLQVTIMTLLSSSLHVVVIVRAHWSLALTTLSILIPLTH